MTERVQARGLTVTSRLCLAAGSGCSSGHTNGGSQTPQAPQAPQAQPLPPQPPFLPDTSRRLDLQVTIAGVDYNAVGLLTADGALRVSVGDDGSGGPALMQIVGNVVQSSGYIVGGGAIYGEACASSPSSRFCGRPSPAEFELPTDEYTKGTIWVTTAAGQETWTWQTSSWYSWSPSAALPSAPPWDAVKGLYSIRGTELAGNAGTVLTIDGQGRLFFQSSETGCTGNGTMTLRPDLNADVYDVGLTIEGCVGAYAYLNNQFEGLSIVDNDAACTGCWDDGVGLLDTPRLWLSMPTGVAALSFSADPVD
jgi:hypothetical protein